MRVCKKCGNVLTSYSLDTYYCPKCGEPLREVLVKTDDDTFVRALPEDHISCAGYHIGCGLHGEMNGFVDIVWTTSRKKIYRCLGCGLRIPATAGE
jgi:DNA-directed RNA polymerase subunit RPC12/RpoP